MLLGAGFVNCRYKKITIKLLDLFCLVFRSLWYIYYAWDQVFPMGDTKITITFLEITKRIFSALALGFRGHFPVCIVNFVTISH
jgi:hypothetical protein